MTSSLSKALPASCTGETGKHRRRRLYVFGSIVLLTLLAYLPAIAAILSGGWPFTEDAMGLMSVWRGIGRESLSQGLLPLWNPRIFCGLPFMSNGQTSVLYPPNVIYWFLPINLALLLDAVAHNVFLSCGAYLLARGLRLSRTSSWVAAILVGFGGAVSAHIYTGHMTWHAARAYIPWELWALLLYLRTADRRYVVVLALALALQLFSGYPPLVMLGAGLCCGLLFAWTATHREGGRLPRGWAGSALMTVALAGALTAVQVLPLKETSALSVHGAGMTFEEATLLSGSWRSLARLVYPDFFGGNSPFMQWSIIYGAHEEVAYIGLLGLVLALGAPYFARRLRTSAAQSDSGDSETPTATRSRLPSAVVWLWALLPVSAVLALGANTPVYPWLFAHIGLFRQLRVPVRWLEVWAFCAALLAGLAYEATLHRPRTRPSEARARVKTLVIALWVVALVSFLVLASLIILVPVDSILWQKLAMSNLTGAGVMSNRSDRQLSNALHDIAIGSALLGVWWAALPALLLQQQERAARGGTVRRTRLLKQSLLLVLMTDVVFLFWASARTLSRGDIKSFATWPPDLVSRYKPGERWDTGVAWISLNRGMLQGIDLYNGYDALGAKSYFEFAVAAEGKPFWRDMYQPDDRGALTRVAGLTHTITTVKDPRIVEGSPQPEAAADGWKLWRYEGAWPRVYLSRQLHRAPRNQQLAALARLAKSPFNNAALAGPSSLTDIESSALTPEDKVLGWSRTFNTMMVEVNATAPSVVVANETYYPGWRAWVNDKPVQIEPTNYLFRGVTVPSGKSKVSFVYDNSTHRVAMFISLCGLAALAMMCFTLYLQAATARPINTRLMNYEARRAPGANRMHRMARPCASRRGAGTHRKAGTQDIWEGGRDRCDARAR